MSEDADDDVDVVVALSPTAARTRWRAAAPRDEEVAVAALWRVGARARGVAAVARARIAALAPVVIARWVGARTE